MRIGPGSRAVLDGRRLKLQAMFDGARGGPGSMRFVGGPLVVPGRAVDPDRGSPGESMGIRTMPIDGEVQCRVLLRHIEASVSPGSNALSRSISDSLLRLADRRLNADNSVQTRSPVREMRSGGR